MLDPDYAHLLTPEYRYDIKLQVSGSQQATPLPLPSRSSTFETVLGQVKQSATDRSGRYLKAWKNAFHQNILAPTQYRNYEVSRLKLIILGASSGSSETTRSALAFLAENDSAIPQSLKRFLNLIEQATGAPIESPPDLQCTQTKAEVFFFNVDLLTSTKDDRWTHAHFVAYSTQFINQLVANHSITEGLVILDARPPEVTGLENLKLCFKDEFTSHRDYWTCRSLHPPRRVQILNSLREQYRQLRNKIYFDYETVDSIPVQKLSNWEVKINERCLAIEANLQLLNAIDGHQVDTSERLEADMTAWLSGHIGTEVMTIRVDEDQTKVKYLRMGNPGETIWSEGDQELAVGCLQEADASTNGLVRRLYRK